MQQPMPPLPLFAWLAHPRVWRRLMPYMAGVLVSLFCLELGMWQLDRAAYKQALQDHFEEAQRTLLSVDSAKVLKEWQHVQVLGRWVPDQTVFVDNRTYQGRVGFDVLTPLRLTHDDSVVVVNRGWVEGNPDRSILPKVTTPDTEVIIQGLTRKPGVEPFVTVPAPNYVAGDQDPVLDSAKGQIWLYPNLDYYEQRLVEAVAPVLILQDDGGMATNDDGLVRVHPEPQFGTERHEAYAFQWFSLSALLAALTIGFAIKSLGVFRKKRGVKP